MTQLAGKAIEICCCLLSSTRFEQHNKALIEQPSYLWLHMSIIALEMFNHHII